MDDGGESKVYELKGRCWLPLEIVSTQGNWDMSGKNEENHVRPDVNDAAQIQSAWEKQKLENQLAPVHWETKYGAWVKHQHFKFP